LAGAVLTVLAGCAEAEPRDLETEVARAQQISVTADLQAIAAEARTWYADSDTDPVLVTSQNVHYLCEPQDQNNLDACVRVSSATENARFAFRGGGAAAFCVEGEVDGAIYHQGAGGAVEDGPC
jgi:hypothetical protein